MKILILQSAGGHTENKEYRECLCMTRALNRIDGVEAVTWGFGHKNYNIPFRKMESWSDVIFILENYSRKPWLPVDALSASKKLKIFWSIDSHCALNRHQALAVNAKVNILLNSTSSYLKYFKPIKSIWFPNCYPDDLIKPLPIAKSIDVGFCGSKLNRAKWLQTLSRNFNFKQDIFVLGNKMVSAINSYKIHWNRNYKNDINYRTFETMGCRTCLVTNKTDKVNELFEDYKHLVYYNTITDCIYKIRSLLRNEKLLNNIALNGYNEVKSKHTYYHRALRLVNIIKEYI